PPLGTKNGRAEHQARTMTDHPSPKGERAMTPDLREAVARLLAKHVREINRVIASGLHEGDAIYAAADAILALPALSVPEGWVAVPREVVEPFARAADWEERCIDPDYGIARVRPLKDSRRVAVTLGECRAVR